MSSASKAGALDAKPSLFKSLII